MPRKVAFSSKQKKIQLKQKRERKQEGDHARNTTLVPNFSRKHPALDDLDVLNAQPSASGHSKTNRYKLMFKKETDDELQQKRAQAYIPFEPVPEEKLEINYEDIYKPGTVLDMPKRPAWNFSLSKERLEMQEQKYFREYVLNLESTFGDKELSHFEMNLETWRQLWRVVEFSDIILQVTDIRFPVYHFSPALYRYVTEELKKDMILVLNKIDLVPAPLILAWLEYFEKTFPKLKVMCFASFAGMIVKAGSKGRRLGNLHMAIAGARQLHKLCEEIVGQKVDMSSWKEKIDIESAEIGNSGDTYANEDSEDSDDEIGMHKKSSIKAVQNDTSYYEGERYLDGILTLGFVGHPNVGKSSFLNAICGKKVVSVSRTPGHTKHFQTILLTRNIRLCDCPGLVFPSLVPKPIQVLMGCYPIAQLREPFSAVEYLGQRINLQNLLRLTHPDIDSFEKNEKVQWSSYDICTAWAEKRGFRTARTARPDVHRAANHILRTALDGRSICLAFYPPDYTKHKETWSSHPRLQDVLAIQSHRKKYEPASKGQRLDFIPLSDSPDEPSELEDQSSDGGEEDEETKEPPSSSNKFMLLGENSN